MYVYLKVHVSNVRKTWISDGFVSGALLVYDLVHIELF